MNENENYTSELDPEVQRKLDNTDFRLVIINGLDTMSQNGMGATNLTIPQVKHFCVQRYGESHNFVHTLSDEELFQYLKGRYGDNLVDVVEHHISIF